MAEIKPLKLGTSGSEQFATGDSIPVASGGVPSGGTTGQLLAKNSNTNFDLVWTTVAGGGDIINGGNTTGADINIGTNDNFGLNLETSGIPRLNITGGASTGGAVTITNVTANTNTVQDVLTVRANSTGTAAANFGVGLLFQGESSTTDNQDMARIASYWTTATHASKEAAISFQLGDIGGAITETMKLDRTVSTGVLSIGTATPLTLSNNAISTTATSLTLGGNSYTGVVGISSGGTSAGSITIRTVSTASSVQVDRASNAATSGVTRDLEMVNFFTPSSGTAEYNAFQNVKTINQTGGANGIVRFVYDNPTLTSVADYRAFETNANNSNAKGFYQSGSLTTNRFVGKTTHGATTAPTALLMIAAGTATANSAPLKFTSGTLLTTAEAGAVEFNTDSYYVTTTTGAVRRMIVAGNSGRSTAQTAAVASVATYTLGASDASFEVSANVLVTTSSAEGFSVRVSYTDESNTARTLLLNFSILAGGINVAISSANGAVPYHGIPSHIRCKASTAITVATVGVFTGCTYNVEANIRQIA